jgi:hypothetical protein
MFEATRTSWTTTAVRPTRNAPFAGLSALPPPAPEPASPLVYVGALVAFGGFFWWVAQQGGRRQGRSGYVWP